MRKFLQNIKKYTAHVKKDTASVEKLKLSSDVIKSILSVLLSLCLLIVGSFAWFSVYKLPNTADLIINDPAARLKVEQFNPETKEYELLYDEPYDETDESAFELDIPEMMFYRWHNSVASSIVDKLYYKVTVTSRFSPTHFEVNPLFYMLPRLTIESEEEILKDTKIIEAEYLVFDPASGEPPANTFPADGHTLMPLEEDPQDALTSPNVRIVEIDGERRFQSIVYFMVDADNEAVAEVIDSLGASLEGFTAINKINISFGFRSVPFYVPSTP